MEEANIISPVKFSEWAAPVVPVIKKYSTIRLCGDYKVTVNQAANTEVYPLPQMEEILSTLSGGKVFSKIDLAQAYLDSRAESRWRRGWQPCFVLRESFAVFRMFYLFFCCFTC